jgi:hypothetical protein
MADMIRSYPLDMLTIGDSDHTAMRRDKSSTHNDVEEKAAKASIAHGSFHNRRNTKGK